MTTTTLDMIISAIFIICTIIIVYKHYKYNREQRLAKYNAECGHITIMRRPQRNNGKFYRWDRTCDGVRHKIVKKDKSALKKEMYNIIVKGKRR